MYLLSLLHKCLIKFDTKNSIVEVEEVSSRAITASLSNTHVTGFCCLPKNDLHMRMNFW